MVLFKFNEGADSYPFGLLLNKIETSSREQPRL